MAVKPYLVQRRMRELGRVRLGEKGPKGEPRKLTTLRFTSFSLPLLEEIAAKHGGQVRPWEGAPEEGAFEVITDTNKVDIILPPVFSAADGTPTTAYSQFFELWSAGGCQRRCDGETESISGKTCMCNPEERTCDLTTRVSFMLPDIPDIGVWRLDTKGWNAAVELPGTLEVLLLAAAERKFIPAVLRVEPRTKKVPGEGTRRFVVPVIEMPGVTVRQLVSGEVPVAINAPSAPPARPALPSGVEPPAEPEPTRPQPEWGAGVEPEILGDVLAAPEPMVGELCDLAETVGKGTVVRQAVAKHRAAHNGYVDADWLGRQREKLLALTRDNETPSPGPVSAPGGSVFAALVPDDVREGQR